MDESEQDASAMRRQRHHPRERLVSELIVLDEDAIGPGVEPNRFSNQDIGAGEAKIGNRATLDYFAGHVGQEITLPSGMLGDEGWFAFTAMRLGWRNAGPDPDDALRNFYEAGPGLGSPDEQGRPEYLLDKVTGLTPLRATGLGRLEKRSVCAIVYEGDVEMSYAPMMADLQGKTLGKVAFEVISTRDKPFGPENSLPPVRVRILDAGAVCNDSLSLFKEAPEIVSAVSPADVVRPECVIEREVLTEEWDIFDESKWIGDGDQVVSDGLFYANPNAFSAAADYIPATPVEVDPTGAVKFSNRLQLVSDAEHPFAESGALFMVNADKNGDFKNYVFVNVGYTMAPSLLFVELFGSDDGQDFDQFEETSIPFRESRLFNVDLWIRPRSYEVGIGGEMIDTVFLDRPMSAVNLFEVGVQQNQGGLRGLIHSTAITQLCPKENKATKCRQHWSFKGKPWKGRVGKRCHTRNSYIRMAREKIKYTKNPSLGLRCLAQMRELPDEKVSYHRSRTRR